MSIASITNSAVDRREDFPSAPGKKGSLRQVAASKNEKPNTQSAASDALSALAAFIPTEVIGTYIAAIAVTAPAVAGSARQVDGAFLFWGFLIAVPIIVWLVFAGRVKTAGKEIPMDIRKWPKWEMVAATAAFAVWALAIPENPFTTQTWYSAGLVGLAVIVVSTALGLLATVVRGPLKGDSKTDDKGG